MVNRTDTCDAYDAYARLGDALRELVPLLQSLSQQKSKITDEEVKTFVAMLGTLEKSNLGKILTEQYVRPEEVLRWRGLSNRVSGRRR